MPSTIYKNSYKKAVHSTTDNGPKIYNLQEERILLFSINSQLLDLDFEIFTQSINARHFLNIRCPESYKSRDNSQRCD